MINNSGIYISEQDKLVLEAPLSKEKLYNNLKTMPKNKTPGIDGLVPQFYLAFWDKLADYILVTYNTVFKNGRLHISAKRSIITLIPKKAKNIFMVQNWRPFTMLNTDNKTLAKTLASRLKPVLLYVISPDQTGFMTIDFEKCFDRIEHKAILGALKYFGLGSNYINCVKVLLSDFELCTQNAGFMSELFEASRGCRQGCNLALLLYLLCGELLAHIIKENIRGIEVYDFIALLAQFADDTNLFLSYEYNFYGNVTSMLTIQKK